MKVTVAMLIWGKTDFVSSITTDKEVHFWWLKTQFIKKTNAYVTHNRASKYMMYNLTELNEEIDKSAIKTGSLNTLYLKIDEVKKKIKREENWQYQCPWTVWNLYNTSHSEYSLFQVYMGCISRKILL